MNTKSNEELSEERWMIRSRILSLGTCCSLGKRYDCVCMISISCPKHGHHCIGTHD